MNIRAKYIAVLILGLLGVMPQAFATHIIGGQMSYRCISPGRYHFTLKVYRDCGPNNSNNTPFDSDAVVTIYRGNNPSPLRNKKYGAPSKRTIPADVNPCMTITSTTCVEEGTYEFDEDLAIINESYYISYQRCCRNPGTLNINNPRDIGGTYTVEITPAAQRVCNSSPTFSNYPPINICANFDIDFDHSATDIDGDSLAYEFCAPFLGGGPIISGPESTGPNGSAPNPATAPPYNLVSFRAPTYTASRPLAGNPTVRIDPVTGHISGAPTTTGQFSVGVCVREYRNGVLLSTSRRDFQFQVQNCTPTVVADIEHDVEIGTQSYIINSCGENTVTFINESYDINKIQSYEWRFGIGNDLVIRDTRDATVTFPDTGTYAGIMILNKGLQCADTATIAVNIYPDIRANFSYEYDTCVAGPVSFTDLSESDAGPILGWKWDFKDGNFSQTQHPRYPYRVPGDFDVLLEVYDKNQCVDTITKPIQYYPAPAVLIIEPSSFTGCEPLDVFFNNLSFPIDSTYDVQWTFGDGGTGTDISPSYTYENAGVYTVSIAVTSPLGCYVADTFQNWIKVDPSPIADFTYTPTKLSNFDSTVNFLDQSQGSAAWYYDFGDGRFSIFQNPVHEYQDTGVYTVMQIVTHRSGCRDTIYNRLDVEPKITYYLPNAFTPNNDAKNDGYRGAGYFEGMRDFHLTIWNRWGELIFETTDPEEEWNGRKNNQGPVLQTGVYLCLVSFTSPRGEKRELRSYATLVK